MAHESPHRHGSESSQHPPPPPAESHQHLPPPPRSHSSVSSPRPTPQTGRPRASSHLNSDGVSQPQPIKEAVNSAFDKSDMSQFQPDLVKHITEQVINNLKLSGVAGQASQAQAQPNPAQTPMSNSTASMPPRNVYTPPSPEREDAGSNAGSNVGSNAGSHVSSEHRNGQVNGFQEKMAGSTFPDNNSQHSQHSQRSENQSMPTTNGETEDDGETTLEKIWQPLFIDGKPTQRLGQFLRGLAIHIIEDYEPRMSIVITPQKMIKFYEEAKISNELYPWSAIFGGKMSNSSISHLYRDLKCQHHFVQRQYDEKPNVPALTPLGFECWMTHVIRSHPDEEFDRLAKAAMNMPISNADNSKERFPKQLSRRLFPKQTNEPVREYFEDSILADPVIELPRRKSAQSNNSQARPPPQAASHQERPPQERSAPQGAAPHERPPPPGPPLQERPPQTPYDKSSQAAPPQERQPPKQDRAPPQPAPSQDRQNPQAVPPQEKQNPQTAPPQNRQYSQAPPPQDRQHSQTARPQERQYSQAGSTQERPSQGAPAPPTSAPPNHAPNPGPSRGPPPPSSENSFDKGSHTFSASSSDVAVEDVGTSVPIERERKPYYAQPGAGKAYDSDDSHGMKSDNERKRASTVMSGGRPNLDYPDDYNRPSRHYRTGSQATGQPSRPRQVQRSPSNARSNQYARSESDVPPGSYGSNASNAHPETDQDISRQYSRDSRRYVPEEAPRNYAPPPPRNGLDEEQRRPRNGHEDDASNRRRSMQPNMYSGYPHPPPPPASQSSRYGARDDLCSR
ncbi:MAG: hypothetical protein M1831_003085 [Alyxoria varia]|nr:MAG: hypothetical protein M1831_003085 [Alyxoria varia]